MTTLLDMINTAASYAGPFFVLLGLLIFVHELGHFLVAKYFGVRVEVFSLGFGKKILEHKKGDTNYCISLIPLGGYVKMYGDDPTAEIPEEEKQHAFLHKPVGARIAVILAGPLMNLFFAAFIFSAVAMLGEKLPAPVLGDVKPDTNAYESGFRGGMKIQAINGLIVETWNDVIKYIKNHPNEVLSFQIDQGTDSPLNLTAKTTLGKNENLLSTEKVVGTIDGFDTLSNGPTVGISNHNSLAALAGMESIESIRKINNVEIKFSRDIKDLFLNQDFISDLKSNPLLIVETQSLVKINDKLNNYRTIRIEITEAMLSKNHLLYEDLGFENSELFLYQIKSDSPAMKAGLNAGDKLLSVNGKAITKWDTIVQSVKSYNGNKTPMIINVLRKGKTLEISVIPEMTELMKASGAEDNRFTIGIIPAVLTAFAEPVIIKTSNPIVALQKGIQQSWKWTKMVGMSFVRMIQNEVSSKNIGGVITIGKYAGQSYKVGISPFLKLMAIISINLFLINLLPVPILDGGHLLFFTIEAIRGAPLSMKKMEMAQQVGLILLMSLMVFALFNDISNLLNPPW